MNNILSEASFDYVVEKIKKDLLKDIQIYGCSKDMEYKYLQTFYSILTQDPIEYNKLLIWIENLKSSYLDSTLAQ